MGKAELKKWGFTLEAYKLTILMHKKIFTKKPLHFLLS